MDVSLFLSPSSFLFLLLSLLQIDSNSRASLLEEFQPLRYLFPPICLRTFSPSGVSLR